MFANQWSKDGRWSERPTDPQTAYAPSGDRNARARVGVASAMVVPLRRSQNRPGKIPPDGLRAGAGAQGEVVGRVSLEPLAGCRESLIVLDRAGDHFGSPGYMLLRIVSPPLGVIPCTVEAHDAHCDLREGQHARSGTGEPAAGAAALRGSRQWTALEYVDRGVSGSLDRRPALDQLLLDAKRRKFDCVVCWSMDRLGRSLKHLVVLLDDLQALGVGFISIREGLDWTTPSGRLQAQLLAMIAEFERSRLQERVRAGLARAKAEGRRLGRPRVRVAPEDLQAAQGLSVREAASKLGVSTATLKRLRRGSKTPAAVVAVSA